MRQLTFKQLRQELGSIVFCVNLKYDRICMVRRNNQQAWLLPIEENPKVKVLQYVLISVFKQSIGFYVDLLIEAQKKYPNNTAAIGLTAAGFEHLCYLAIDLKYLVDR
jgi:hypothetical protein